MRRTFRACLALFKIRITERLQYRTAAIANASISVFWGFLQIVMFTVFYTYGNPDSAALSLPQAISYAWLVQIFLGLVGVYNIDGELREKIVNGDVALELCRPLDLYSHWFARIAANRVGGFPYRAIITFGVAILMPTALGLSAPASILGLVMFLLSLCTGFLLVTAFSMLLVIVRMALNWGDGPVWILIILGGVFSGSYLPLPLWPDFLQGILMFQPFAGLLDIPLRLYVGSIPPGNALLAICIQLIWASVFIAIGKVLMHRQTSRLIVQGG